MARPAALLALLIAGGVYWQVVCQLDRVAEPWDAARYWTLWYPVSFVLAAVAGAAMPKRAWLAGIIVTAAQLPVMWANTGIPALWMLGVAMCAVLAVPVSGVAALAGWTATRARRAL
ncbi:hypothetical protein FHT00_001197 [Sphingomonas insulae]|nr:hypothetical protein [Sphingomonas insulae]NIJ29264.1 hypothetical protein [Sphingomonas insulae]